MLAHFVVLLARILHVKGYYEIFCCEVYMVVIFLIEDSVMQKSILTYDEMVLNFFIYTIANFVYE